MNVVGKVGSFISQGVYSVATPFHPFGGAVDVIVVQQQDGTFRTTPWYVRFGKFQGVLKGSEKVVRISVNGAEADFHMYLDNSGKAYFVHEVESSKDGDEHIDSVRLEHSVSDTGLFPLHDHDESLRRNALERAESEANRRYYDFQDDQEDSVEFSEYGSNRFEGLDDEQERKPGDDDSEVILVSVDGHVLTAPVSSSEKNSDNVRLSTPQFHLGPAEGEEEIVISECVKGAEDSVSNGFGDKNDEEEHKHMNEDANCQPSLPVSCQMSGDLEDANGMVKKDVFQSCLELSELATHSETPRSVDVREHKENCVPLAPEYVEADQPAESDHEQVCSRDSRLEMSLCGKDLYAGMGHDAASKAFESHRVSLDKFIATPESVTNNECLIIRCDGKYFPWQKAAPFVLGFAVFGLDLVLDPKDAIPVEEEAMNSASGSRRWTLWPNPFRRSKTLDHTTSNSSSEDYFVDTESGILSSNAEAVSPESPQKQLVRSNLPTSDQIASLNLKDGQNLITFMFSTRVLGKQQVEAHLYLWKWNTRIVISDVDGTITKSDVLGQFMPLVGKDWSQSGVAKLFSAIKENGYQLLFLSARAIVQAYLTKNFLFNLKQDGKTLPNGPVVISPDGLFPSLFREVIRRAPHEFKIACLEDIRRLFPPDYNPFYAGFGNRDTDELSYRKIGIPKGKIFIINPKGEVAVSHCIDVKSYTSLHTLVNDMFPPTSLVEQEDYNAWNFWKVPLPEIDL